MLYERSRLTASANDGLDKAGDGVKEQSRP